MNREEQRMELLKAEMKLKIVLLEVVARQQAIQETLEEINKSIRGGKYE